MQDTARDKRIPYYFVAFFVGFVALLSWFASVAIRTQTGLITEERPYEVGLAYNKVIEAADAQTALGWKATITLTPTPDIAAPHSGIITALLRDKNGAIIAPDAAKLVISRPIQKGHDFTVQLATKDDQQGVPVTFPLQGQWEVRAYFTAQGNSFQYATRVMVP